MMMALPHSGFLSLAQNSRDICPRAPRHSCFTHVFLSLDNTILSVRLSSSFALAEHVAPQESLAKRVSHLHSRVLTAGIW